MSTAVLERELHSHLVALPDEQKREVLDFAAFLRHRIKVQKEAEMEAQIREMAQDEAANADALELCEAFIGDIADEER